MLNNPNNLGLLSKQYDAYKADLKSNLKIQLILTQGFRSDSKSGFNSEGIFQQEY